MTLALLSGVFVASLLGSLHCVGMCGGIACFVGGTASRGRALTLYHVGRALSYAAVGALAGAIGQTLDLGGEAVGLGRVGTLLAGALLVTTAALMLARGFGFRVGTPAAAKGGLGRLWQRTTRLFADADAGPRAFALGVLTVLLPCGWLYLFLATAAASGGALAGATVMITFWAGTVPALLAVGFAAKRIAPALRQRLPIAAAGLLLVIAVTALLPRLAPPVFAAAPAGEEPACCAE